MIFSFISFNIVLGDYMVGWSRTALRKQPDKSWVLERRMYIQNDKLIYEFNSCNGCDLCSAACPKEALKVQAPEPTLETDPRDFTLEIDENLCVFCGTCAAACVYHALSLEVNDEHVIPVEEKEVFPRLVPEMKFDAERAKSFCVACSCCFSSCPHKAISIKFVEGFPVLERDIETCGGCHTCEVSCPNNVIIANTAFQGDMTITQETCIEECTKCIDICPMDALIKGSPCDPEDKELHYYKEGCTFCGACIRVCPTTPKTLTLKREKMFQLYKDGKPFESGVLDRLQELLLKPKS